MSRKIVLLIAGLLVLAVSGCASLEKMEMYSGREVYSGDFTIAGGEVAFS